MVVCSPDAFQVNLLGVYLKYSDILLKVYPNTLTKEPLTKQSDMLRLEKI